MQHKKAKQILAAMSAAAMISTCAVPVYAQENNETTSALGITRVETVDTQTGNHAGASTSTSITTTVSLTGLTQGKKYRLVCECKYHDYYPMETTTCKEKEVSFVAEGSTMDIPVVLDVDSSRYSEDSLGISAILYTDGSDKMLSYSKYDESRSESRVTYPIIKANLTNKRDNLHQAKAQAEEQLVDDVLLWHLPAGEEFTVNGSLYYKEDFDANKNGVIDADEPKSGDPVLDKNGNHISQSVTFTASGSLLDREEFADVRVTNFDGTYDGHVNLMFTVDTTDMNGASIMVYNELVSAGVPLYSCKGDETKIESVRIPDLTGRIVFLSGVSDQNTIQKNKDGVFDRIEILDRINYRNLWTRNDMGAMSSDDIKSYKFANGHAYSHKVIENEHTRYILKGTLLDGETMEPLTNKKGETYEAHEILSPTRTSDEEALYFNLSVSDFDTEGGISALDGRHFCVSEKLYRANSIEEISEDNLLFTGTTSHKLDLSQEAKDRQNPAKTGWIKENGKWYHYSTANVMDKGWKKVDNAWYFFDDAGVMQTGWHKIGGKWYYFNGNGTMKTGWMKNSGKWYFFNGNGVMHIGWAHIGNVWYYMNGSGVMVTGWQKIGNAWYYFNGSGVMRTGWIKDGTKWYFMNGNGVMQTNWSKIGGKWYFFGGNGVMRTGWVKTGQTWYYFNGSGVMVTGKQNIGGKTYTFASNGVWKY